jgi:hypothetical protein
VASLIDIPSTHVHVTGGGMDPRLVNDEMRQRLQPPPKDDVVDYVRSIIVSAFTLETDIPLEDILWPSSSQSWHQISILCVPSFGITR